MERRLAKTIDSIITYEYNVNGVCFGTLFFKNVFTTDSYLIDIWIVGWSGGFKLTAREYSGDVLGGSDDFISSEEWRYVFRDTVRSVFVNNVPHAAEHLHLEFPLHLGNH